MKRDWTAPGFNVFRIELCVVGASAVKNSVAHFRMPERPSEPLTRRGFQSFLEGMRPLVAEILHVAEEAERNLENTGMVLPETEASGPALPTKMRVYINVYDINSQVIGRVLGTLDVYILGEHRQAKTEL